MVALELFQHSRAATGIDAAGNLVLLEDQDRSRWNAAADPDGPRMLTTAKHTLQHLGTPPGPHLLQPRIAVEQPTAPTAAATNFALLDTLNLDAHLGEYHLVHATRADLLRRAGRPTDARPHYRRALVLAPSDPERRFLQRRMETLGCQ